MNHNCPVCNKELPDLAYEDRYMGCIEFLGVDKATGYVATGYGTIKLSKEPNKYDTILPRENFEKVFDAIRAKQETGSVRVSRCI